jgi:hypothetical protein
MTWTMTSTLTMAENTPYTGKCIASLCNLWIVLYVHESKAKVKAVGLSKET